MDLMCTIVAWHINNSLIRLTLKVPKIFFAREDSHAHTHRDDCQQQLEQQQIMVHLLHTVASYLWHNAVSEWTKLKSAMEGH